MLTVWIISGVIVLTVLGLSLFTTHKGYQYKHTVDPLPDDAKQEEDIKDSAEKKQ